MGHITNKMLRRGFEPRFPAREAGVSNQFLGRARRPEPNLLFSSRFFSFYKSFWQEIDYK